jgi:DNA ligase-1
MQRFAHLVRALAEGAGDAAAAGHVRAYLDAAAPADAAWAVHLLGRDRRRAAAAAAAVRAAAARAAGLDDALFAACLEQTGDLAEAVALVQPRAGSFVAEGLAQWMAGRVEPLRGLDAPAQVERLALDFAGLDAAACELHARLALGRLPPLDRRVLRHALAAHAGIDPGVAALRLERALGARTPPDARGWEALVARAPRATTPRCRSRSSSRARGRKTRTSRPARANGSRPGGPMGSARSLCAAAAQRPCGPRPTSR